MDQQQTQELLHASEQAVSQLIEFCRQHHSGQPDVPRARANVGRTGNWLLHALARFRRALEAPSQEAPSRS